MSLKKTEKNTISNLKFQQSIRNLHSGSITHVAKDVDISNSKTLEEVLLGTSCILIPLKISKKIIKHNHLYRTDPHINIHFNKLA